MVARQLSVTGWGLMIMKRSVIQIADSTQLISLPRAWCKQFDIKKGDELDVEPRGNKLEVCTERGYKTDNAELDITNLDPMVLRCVVALYKKGTDEIKLTFNDVHELDSVQKLIGKEAVGYEIVDQGRNYCLIRHVSGELGDFDSILRRTFLLLLNMAKEAYTATKNKEYGALKNISYLEEANNRFTTTCRRLLNKKGLPDDRKIGALYYIVEELENLADQYKYLCNYLSSKGNKLKLDDEVLDLFKEVNDYFQLFYELFYKYDKKKLVQYGKGRKDLIEKAHALMESDLPNENYVVLHNLLVICQKTFCLGGPYLVLAL